LAEKDSRIILMRNETNLKLAKTLNNMIAIAKGKYIARMDADDISLPKRIALQVETLEKDKNLIICSSNRLEFNELTGRCHHSSLPLSDSEIRVASIFSSPFTHPSVVLRKDIIIENELLYNTDYEFSQDYELWIRILKYGKGINIPDNLLYYRVWNNNQTARKIESSQYIKKVNILKDAFVNLHINLDKNELDFHYNLSLTEHIRNIDFGKYSEVYIKNYFLFLKRELQKNDNITNITALLILGKIYLKLFVHNKRIIRQKFIFSIFFFGGLLWAFIQSARILKQKIKYQRLYLS
jgi:glycosyltransferase involved in cell wall biosynthesis